jgi:glycosyltransferase involved in cell wall biosynthesis
MTSSAISIAMTTYNGAAYLPAQLESLAVQKLLPAELVVGDDGSIDETLEILEAFAKTAPFPVHIHRNPNRLGYRANFMNVVKLCKSPLISFCDHDDVWLPDNLARVAERFEDPETLLVFHNALMVDSDLRPISRFYAIPMPVLSSRLTMSPWMFSYGFTQSFRADLLPAAEFWEMMKDHHHMDQAMGHDLFFFLIASGLGNVAYIDDELTHYRIHAGNTIGSGKRTKPNFLERWRYRLEDRSETYRYLARIAPLDASLFARLAELQTLKPELRERAAEAASAWEQIGPLYHDRAAIYLADFLTRLKTFLDFHKKGAYSETSFWTFGGKAMVKDFILGVLLAPLLKRFGRASSRSDRSCRRGRNYKIMVGGDSGWLKS